MNHSHGGQQLIESDVIVVGVGPVGLAAALTAAAAGWRTVLLSKAGDALASSLPIDTKPTFADLDPRVYALTPESIGFLERLGVVGLIPSSRLSAIRDIEVYQAQASGVLRFDSAEVFQDRLATVVEHQVMVQALSLANRFSRIERVDGTLARLEQDADRVLLTLEDQRQLSARLVVAADGVHSKVRELAMVQVAHKAFDQTAIVVNFDCVEPHGDVARQWFTPNGVVALLPLPIGPNAVNLVWSAPTSIRDELMSLDDNSFARRVEGLVHGIAGRMSVVGRRQSVALQQQTAQSQVAGRVVLVGDAAHVVHPMAGHGLNLGLGDVDCLACLWPSQTRGASQSSSDPGGRLLLRRFERSRREPIAAITGVTSGLHQLFFSVPKPLEYVRNLGWQVLSHPNEVSSFIRRKLVGRASTN